MTQDDLDYIDMLCSVALEATSPPRPTLCALPSGEHDFVDVEDIGFGDSFAGLTDWMSRRPYERSPWVRDSVTGRCVPLLYALALKAHGRFSPVLRPFWTDGDPSHMSSANVSLMPVRSTVPQGPVRNKYGHRSTTAEYRKAYYSDPVNKARNAAHQRRTQAKKRAESAAIQKIVDNNPDIAARVADLEAQLLGKKDTK